VSNARKNVDERSKETHNGVSGGEGRKNRGFRTLPYLEYVKKRREEGRCFHYGGAYSYGHRCLDKNLSVVICGDSEEKKEKGGMKGFEENFGEESDMNNRGFSISLSVLSVGG